MRNRRVETVDLREVFAKSFAEPLLTEDIGSLSTSSKCALIRRILEARRAENPYPAFDTSKMSLLSLSKAFEISTDFHEWQRKRRQIFIRELTSNENKPVLTAYRNWNKISTDAKKFALRQSVRLQRKSYVEGLSEKLPYNHDFQEGAIRSNGSVVTLVFGGFSGDLKTGRGRITQYSHHGELIHDALEAFNTAHHEGTHLIQHHLSVAFHRKQIAPSHPLYHDAEYFHSVDTHRAYIPSSLGECYKVQPNEVLADWEGNKISAAIAALAL